MDQIPIDFEMKQESGVRQVVLQCRAAGLRCAPLEAICDRDRLIYLISCRRARIADSCRLCLSDFGRSPCAMDARIGQYRQCGTGEVLCVILKLEFEKRWVLLAAVGFELVVEMRRSKTRITFFLSFCVGVEGFWVGNPLMWKFSDGSSLMEVLWWKFSDGSSLMEVLWWKFSNGSSLMEFLWWKFSDVKEFYYGSFLRWKFLR